MIRSEDDLNASLIDVELTRKKKEKVPLLLGPGSWIYILSAGRGLLPL